ncbi:FKBP-type peptidyl-prolyl cis-trans isomerase [Kineosporia sp. J2-2]|uniref:Peptidyl-prolyl cis-trans isomerase n=1 Tax=Kineosporia corallincola TaxID=2835133 RepID=A0ABS5TQJ5_9ACTN|nr:FKBP-type peptidyl-prolyl cis-trans isomerase [Kineosporia corallincola]MBT0771939.1 FKBP-type peptidyl-prolyl cis-trans isomerase [Kineosporia corallincola]
MTVLSGCASASSGGDAGPSTTTDINQIKVSGKYGDAPELDIPVPFSTEKTTRRVISQGKGDKVERGQRVTVNYVGVNGADNTTFDNSFGSNKKAMALYDSGVIKGFVDGIEGARVGSRILLAVPPADAYGTSGVSSAGIGPTDTLIFVIDIDAAADILKRATGTKVKAKAGLPTVKLKAKTGEPTVTVPSTEPSDSLVVQPLIEGKGKKVEKGQTITVHYTGVNWRDGTVFDSSWTRGAPASFPIGVGGVITGWDKSLVGKTVGSQILLVIPPDEGYGAAGEPSAGIKGTDTLIFVVDILDTAVTTNS